MKRTLLVLAGLAFMAACSSPKYTYNFGHYNCHAGMKKETAPALTSNDGPQPIQPELLTASAGNEVGFVETATPAIENKAVSTKKTYGQMTKAERKEVRSSVKEIKKVIEAEKEGIKESASTKGMDHDLKLAAIFGAVGIIALIISGQVFYIIGGIAMLIGVVFFVKWIIRQ